MSSHRNNPSQPDTVTAAVLTEIARQFGTPTYAFDIRRLRVQVEKLRSELPDAVEIFYSLKANASLGICDVFADCGIGADVASAGELATAVEAGFAANRLFVAGPFKSAETISQLRSLPEAIVSIDSLSELQRLASAELPNRAVLRLRPDFGSHAVCAAGCDSRFGFLLDDVPKGREFLRDVNVIGFHVFAGSQVLSPQDIVEHIRGSMNLALSAAESLGITPQFLNLGGGFGIPYGPGKEELDLRPVREELALQIERAAPARIALELGRYLVAQAGWYLTSVLGYQTFQGRTAVVVDGGTHQRADMCGLGLRSKAHPPVVLGAADAASLPTDVLGCLSLPADVMSEASALPPLSPGDVLAYANAGAYGVWSSPALFHGSLLPAEVAFDGTSIQVMRERLPTRSILADQRHLNRSLGCLNSTRPAPAMLRKALSLLSTALDANGRRPQVWAAMLTGGVLGFVWGVTARLWMRLISTKPEFSVGGTVIIIAISTIFGLCAGLAFAARRRGWTKWRHYVPRALTVAFFVPFGFGGGGPLMLTVLLATLAFTWPVVPRIVLAVFLLLILVATAASGGGLIAAVLLVTLVVMYVTWKLVAKRASEHRMKSLKLWRSRIARGFLLIVAAGVLVAVSVPIVRDTPGMLGPAYVCMYLLLLCPLFFGLRIGLQPATQPTHCEIERL